MTVAILDALLTEPGDGSVQRSLGSVISDFTSVKRFGAAGDGETDDHSALQAAINSGRALYFPPGAYLIGEPLKFGAADELVMVGEGVGRTSIRCDYAAADFDYAPMLHPGIWVDLENVWRSESGAPATANDAAAIGTSRIFAHGMLFNAGVGNLGGQCITLTGALSSRFVECRFSFVHRGIFAGQSSFDLCVDTCTFTGHFFSSANEFYSIDNPEDVLLARTAQGIFCAGHHTIKNVGTNGCGVAISVGGSAGVVDTLRLENPFYGMIIGEDTPVYPTAAWPDREPGEMLSNQAYAKSINSVSIEGPWVGVEITNLRDSSISGISVQGKDSTQVGRPWVSKTGLRVRSPMSGATLGNSTFSGNFTDAATRYDVLTGGAVRNTNVSNGTAAVAKGALATVNDRAVTSLSKKRAVYAMHRVPVFPGAVYEQSRTVTAFHDLMLSGLTGLDVHSRAADGEAEGGAVFARNLGGTVTPDNAASSAAVVFSAGGGDSRFSSQPAAVEDVTSELEAGTYYYASIGVGPRGQNGYGGNVDPTEWVDTRRYMAVEVSEGERVDISLATRSWMTARRIYRGRALDEFDGYWEIPTGQTSFSDDGTQPFDGLDAPTKDDSSIASQEEIDDNYQIIATPSWATTVHVSDKATTGFTLNFGTAAPDGAQTVAWLLFRP